MRRLTDRLAEARRDQRGFTLIELLIVIIILGVLAAIVVFSVRGITNNSKVSACKTEVRIVNTAIEAYYAKNGNYDGTGAAGALQLSDLVAGGLLHDVPSEYVNGITAGAADGSTPPTAKKVTGAPC